MRAEVVHGVVERAAQVLIERGLVGRRVVEGDHLLEEGRVARLADVGADAQHEPERVVVEVRADVRVAALGERLELVVRGAVGELRRGDVEEAGAGARRHLVHDAEHVLGRVAEADAAADAALEVGRAAREVVGDDALVLVPERHALELCVARAGEREVRELRVPERAQRAELAHRLGDGREAPLQRERGRLVDHGHRGVRLQESALGLLRPLVLLRHLDVAEDEHERPAFAGRELDLELVRGDGRPAVGDGVAGLAGKDRARGVVSGVRAEERLAVGVEAVGPGVHGVERVVVAALAVFGLVVDRAAEDLHLAGGEVALEVRAVVLRVPEAPLDERREDELLRLLRLVLEREHLHLRVGAVGDEEEQVGADAVLRAGDLRVAEAVAALVEVERRARGLEAGIPDRVAVLDVEVTAVGVQRDVVVAVAREAAQAGVLVERVAAGRVRHEREEVLVAEVVDPGVGRVRRLDDVFAGLVVEVSEFHGA